MIQLILILIITGIATARLSLLVSESKLFQPLRVWFLGGGPPSLSQSTYWAFNLIGQGLICSICVSWWVGGFLSLLWLMHGSLGPLTTLLCWLCCGYPLELLLALRRPLIRAETTFHAAD